MYVCGTLHVCMYVCMVCGTVGWPGIRHLGDVAEAINWNPVIENALKLKGACICMHVCMYVLMYVCMYVEVSIFV